MKDLRDKIGGVPLGQFDDRALRLVQFSEMPMALALRFIPKDDAEYLRRQFTIDGEQTAGEWLNSRS